MISYRIVSNWGKTPSNDVFPITPKDPAFKDIVLERAYRNARNWHAGQHCKMRGTSRRGVIKEVIREHSKVNWVNNRPYFIVVEFVDGKTEVCNPTQLRRKSK